MRTLQINGKPHSVDAPDDMPLLWVLRDLIGLTGTKYGCGVGSCGACAVHIDGKVEHSCRVPVSSVGNRAVTTIEAIGATPVGARVQKAWLDAVVSQCGYCQPGQVMAATALLNATPHPSEAEIDEVMRRNICRCGTYVRIRQAIKNAAQPA
ncbi:MAG: (2Fe-2S)-binding protein [Burkholderiaceae bacterium]|jgi:isoquinoline 1-oxidoreductase alpha subunit|nr:(2Fe-2S)-binding protein [Burkholderiaceae bacterium]